VKQYSIGVWIGTWRATEPIRLDIIGQFVLIAVDVSSHPTQKAQMRKTAIASVLVALVFSFSCDTTEVSPRPPEPGPTITLSLENVGVTEAWLRVTVADTVAHRTVVLVPDDQSIDAAFVSSADTLLFDDGLMPHHVCEYKAYVVSAVTGGYKRCTSGEHTLLVCTTGALGDGSSSTFALKVRRL